MCHSVKPGHVKSAERPLRGSWIPKWADKAAHQATGTNWLDSPNARAIYVNVRLGMSPQACKPRNSSLKNRHWCSQTFCDRYTLCVVLNVWSIFKPFEVPDSPREPEYISPQRHLFSVTQCPSRHLSLHKWTICFQLSAFDGILRSCFPPPSAVTEAWDAPD